MDLDCSFKIPANVLAREVGSETVLLDLESGMYFGLDEVGSRIWKLFIQGKTINEVCASLLVDYEVDWEKLLEDAQQLASDLVKRKLIATNRST